jgi:hypothetical protein
VIPYESRLASTGERKLEPQAVRLRYPVRKDEPMKS